MGDEMDAAAAEVVATEQVSLVVASIEALKEQETGVELTLAQLSEMGFITPIADPRTVRAANQYRLKMIGAMLDPNHDFLYTIAYQENGSRKEFITTVLKEAQKVATAYGAAYKANVKKSGVFKLCQVLCLEGKIIEHLGYPHDPKAEFTQIRYEVRHKKTGRTEQGIGLASLDERPGRLMPKHHLVTLADTRAHSRAVMRIAGLGEVGAEELMTGVDETPLPTITAPHPNVDGLTVRLPANTSEPIDVRPTPQRAAEPATVRQAAPAVTAAPLAASTFKAQAAPTSGGDEATITDAQAVKLSQLAKQKLGTVERCKAWLVENAKVESSRAVRERDYPALMKTLEAMEVP